MRRVRKYFIYDYVNDQVLGTELTAGEVEKTIGLKSHHVANQCDDCTINQGQYMIFDDDGNYPVDFVNFKIHDRLVKRQIKNIKEKLRHKIEKAYRKEIEGSKYYNKYYALDSRGNPTKIFDNVTDIAEHFGIPIGTAKSRMFRVGSFEYKGYPEMCAMSDYEKVRKHYY